MGEDKTGLYEKYISILKEELVPAFGCTEPIALAYGAAYARQVLGKIPESIHVRVSGNLIKNVKSVIVPNTGGLKGIQAAVAAGIIAGNADRKLEVICEVDDSQREQIAQYLDKTHINIELEESSLAFDYTIIAKAGQSSVLVRIANAHTNVVRVEKDGICLKDVPVTGEGSDGMTDHTCLTIENIVCFAEEADLKPVHPVLERQIQYNEAIAEEGLRGSYGANIGKVLLNSYGDGLLNIAKARAAAGSDARMNGCAMPVIILSGSGNQGITASLPVLTYARAEHADSDKLYRALAVADLVAIHLKTKIGRLSAFCGAVCAGAGAGAGICYLQGGRFKEIAHTVVNALAVESGMICDGAKASCAAKIALAVESGITGWNMYKNGQQFLSGDGIVSKGVENTIMNVGFLGHDGMKETDKKILEIMTQ